MLGRGFKDDLQVFKRICFIAFPGYLNILCFIWKRVPFAFFPFFQSLPKSKGPSQIINSHLAVTSTSSFSAFLCQQPFWLAWKMALKRDLGSLMFCWCQVFAGHAQRHQNCLYLPMCPYYKLAANQFRASLSGCIHLNSGLLELAFTGMPI